MDKNIKILNHKKIDTMVECFLSLCTKENFTDILCANAFFLTKLYKNIPSENLQRMDMSFEKYLEHIKNLCMIANGKKYD